MKKLMIAAFAAGLIGLVEANIENNWLLNSDDEEDEEWAIYMVLLIVLFILGCYLLIKREWPDFFTSRLLGIYLFVLGLLVIMHTDFIAENQNNLMYNC